MTAVDTNVLVYARHVEFPQHKAAHQLLESLADGDEPWALPVFCLAEFIRVVTHPRFLRKPATLEAAVKVLGGLLDSPSVEVLLPGARFAKLFLETAGEAGATGNLAFDAQIAAVCREQGVTAILSNDRDLARFPGLKVLPIR